MKKVLTILLTLVMAVTLINLNNSHTKAEESNQKYTIKYYFVSGTECGFDISPNIAPGYKFTKGDELEFKYDAPSPQSPHEYKVYDPYGVEHNIQSGNNYTYIVEHSGTGFTCNPSNGTFNITDDKIVQCEGLEYKDVGGNKDWYNGGNKITDYTAFKNTYGIDYDSATNTAVFSKSLYTSATSYDTVKISSALKIELDADVSIKHTGGKVALYILGTPTNIDGKEHKLVLSNIGGTPGPKKAIYLSDDKNLTLKNITLVCEHSSNETTAEFNGGLYLEGEVLIETTNDGTGPALTVTQNKVTTDDVHFANNAPIKTKVGNTDPIKTNLEPVKKYTESSTGADDGVYVLDKTGYNPAKYVMIQQSYKIPTPEPSPEPSPSKKDESCEKVIGPTWHWNNDKGICEDYGVVGTSTR